VRQLAQEKRTQIALGFDPSEDKASKYSAPTFAQFIDEQYLPHVKTYKRYMDDITRQDIVKMHIERKASGAAAGSANRLLIMMRFIFNLAIRWEVPGVKENPSKNVPLMPAS